METGEPGNRGGPLVLGFSLEPGNPTRPETAPRFSSFSHRWNHTGFSRATVYLSSRPELQFQPSGAGLSYTRNGKSASTRAERVKACPAIWSHDFINGDTHTRQSVVSRPNSRDVYFQSASKRALFSIKRGIEADDI